MDGFLALIGILSTIHIPRDSTVQEPAEQVQRELSEGTRLSFTIIAEALRDHEENTRYFKVRP
jgi:hypothetical protein